MASWRSVEAGIVVGGVLLVVAAVLVTVGGPVDYVSAPAPTSRPVQTLPDPAVVTATPSASTPPGWDVEPATQPWWLQLLLQLVVLLVAVGAAYLLFRLGHHRLDLAGRRARASRLPAPMEATPLPEVPEELVGASAVRRRALLAEGEPRNAIVATWLALEQSTAASGLPRRPAETPGEYVSRVLSTWDVDVRALADLADLYREARFSSHTIGPEQRDRAMRDLDRVHADIDAAQAARP